jgi:hypothetical protein
MMTASVNRARSEVSRLPLPKTGTIHSLSAITPAREIHRFAARINRCLRDASPHFPWSASVMDVISIPLARKFLRVQCKLNVVGAP